MAQSRSTSVSASQALIGMLVLLQCAFLIQGEAPSLKDILLGKADLPPPGSQASNELFNLTPKQQPADKVCTRA